VSGWRWCATDGKHWGIRGAGGLLPFTSAPDGIRVLLALRSEGTHQGGTWGTVGGAIEPGETPWDAAVREAGEEADGLPLTGAEPAGSHRYDCRCGWAYTTFPVRMPDDAAVIVPGWENRELRWVPAEDVDRYDLHPGLARSWPELRKMIETARLSRTRQWTVSSGPPGAPFSMTAMAGAAPGTPLPATPLHVAGSSAPRVSAGCSGCWCRR
jgi:8-oxo-dGTP pyrophosphatase MutT (NUDIX family)